MKILVTGLNFTPELTGIGKYTGEMAQWLAARGVEVRVVAAPPYYPQWRVAPGHASRRYRVERVGDVRVYRCPLYVPARPTALRRIVHLLSFALTSAPVLLWQALTWRPDVVFVVEPPLVAAPAAWVAARLCGARCWLHVQDFELDAAFELGILRMLGVRALLSRLERTLMRRFDRVSTISRRMLARLEAKGVAEEHRWLFPNWADLERIRPVPGPSPLRARLELAENAIVLLYAGSFGAKQGLELLVEVMRSLDGDPAVTLVLCGDGPDAERLRDLARGLDTVRFLPLQPIEALNDLMNLADIHALPQRAGAEDLVMPSKLTTMMASGRAVIACASPESEVSRVLDDVGRVVEPGDVAAFARAVRELALDPSLRERFGSAGRARARALWDRDAVLSTAFDTDPEPGRVRVTPIRVQPAGSDAA